MNGDAGRIKYSVCVQLTVLCANMTRLNEECNFLFLFFFHAIP